MEITAQLVSRLREQTGAGLMECKKALVECEGNLEKAVDLLRVRGKAGAEKRAGRAAADGVVAAHIEGAAAAIAELNSETDFVARNDEFRAAAAAAAKVSAALVIDDPEKLLDAQIPADTEPYSGQKLRDVIDQVTARLREHIVLRRAAVLEAGPGEFVNAYVHTVTHKIAVVAQFRGDAENPDHLSVSRNTAMHIAAARPSFVRREDVPAETLERERQVLAEKTRAEGKPEAAIAKIVEGRLGKFYEQMCLLDQPYVRDPSVTVGQMLKAAGVEALAFRMFTVGQE